jgi:xanthine dehydrogenase accessory factor
MKTKTKLLGNDAILEKAAQLTAQGTAFALVTVVRCESPSSAKPGAKALVYGDGTIEGWIGGGCAQPAVIKTAIKALKDGRPSLIRISPDKDGEAVAGLVDFGMTCHSGGTLDIFVDPVVSRVPLVIIGAAPTAQALCALASRVGFHVTAVFPNANAELFPEAHQVIDGFDVTPGNSPIAGITVVATQGKNDEEGLEAALSTAAPYIVFIASAKKAAKLKQFLIERGHDAGRVAAIAAPAGIEIGAVTPEEIALSVLADVVRQRRMGGAFAASHARDTNAAAAQAVDPVCGMSVEIAGAEHTAAYGGAKYYFCCAHCRHAFESAPEKYLEKIGAHA